MTLHRVMGHSRGKLSRYFFGDKIRLCQAKRGSALPT
jgi:hypothetical protein